MLKRLNCWEHYLKVNEKEAIGDDQCKLLRSSPIHLNMLTEKVLGQC